MKKSVLGLIALIFVSLSSFTSNVVPEKKLTHSCTYRMYNASGQYLGTLTTTFPDVVDCGSLLAKWAAIEIWNNNH